MNQSSAQTVLLAIGCLQLLFLLMREVPQTAESEWSPSLDGVETRLQAILEQLQSRGALRSESVEGVATDDRSGLPGSDLDKRLAEIDDRLAKVVTGMARSASFRSRKSPRPSLQQNHQAWMQFKKSIGDEGVTDLKGARFNFMTYDEVLVTFGRPTYIKPGHGGQLWTYEREHSANKADDYYFTVEFADGFVTRVQ